MEFYKDCGSSNLLDDNTKKELSRVFKKLRKRTILLAVLEKDSPKSIELAQLLNTLSALSPDLECEYFLAGENHMLEKQLDNQNHYPAFGIFDGDLNFSGLSYLGIPGGKELNSLIYGLYNVSGAGQPINGKNKKRILALSTPHRIKIYVSLSCHYCSNTVIACQQISSLNPLISAQMIDAALFPDLIEKYKIERIPLITLDENQLFWGEKSLDALISLLEDAN